MKKLIVALIALIAINTHNAQAQNRGNMSPEEMAESRTKQMTKDLDLTEVQQKEVAAINLKSANEVGKLRGRGQNLSEDERKALRSKMRDAQVSMQKDMKGILSEEQYKKWDKMQKEMMNKRREQRGNSQNK